mgnify:FL=1
MLRKLLQILGSGGIHTFRQLAQQLDVSEKLLDSMIDELVRMGYLKPLDGKCTDDCSHCPIAGVCTVAGLGRMWTLTEAGKRIAQC